MRRPDYDRRVAVTGLGIVSPIGQDLETVWTNLVEGNSGLKRITRFDPSPYEAQAAGEVNDFEPTEWMDFKAIRRTDRNVVMGVAVAKKALADAGLEITPENRDEIGVIFGSGGGGPQLIMDNKTTWETKGSRAVSPFFIANMLPDTASGQIAIETGIRGHNMCVVTACSTGTHNIGEAAEGIRRGDFVAAVAGATENPLHEIVHIGFSNMRGMGLPRPGEPIETVSRPFDATRNGFVLGEGAGALILEDLEHARARGAKVYAEVVGYGSAADAWDLIQPIEKGDGVRRAMLMALERHGVPADQVDLINPHGTSTPLGDLREAQAIWDVFGERTPSIAISATKSLTGHLMGAAGAVEGVFTVLSVHHQCAPATLNYRDKDPEIELDVVSGGARAMEIRYALSDNIGLGGHNGAVIFKRYEGD
ncbi:MAG TPA: beta-ketoacyl-ACP synthase II [Candidatus Limnocylindrales bacterium]|nr:beta-ketoacyl-ACP synthase II [Candidatus Limnocylindrales bacterium]